MEIHRSTDQSLRWFTIGVSSLIVISLAVFGLAKLLGVFDTKPAEATTPTLQQTPNAAPRPLSSGSDVLVDGYDFALKPMPHAKGVIIDGGFPATSTPEERKQIVLKAAAHDPFVLWYAMTRYYNFPEAEVPTVSRLKNFDLRVEWHRKLQLLVKASSFKDVSLDGKTLFNEGVNSNGRVTAQQTTFGRGVRGTEITMGGKVTTVKNSCVNRQVITAPSRTIILPKKIVHRKIRHRHLVPCPNRRNPCATQPVQSNPPHMTDPTPGYQRGNAEQIVGTQKPSDGSHSTPNGSPGTGSGGTTPVGTGASPPTNDPVPSGGTGLDRPAGSMPPPPD